ASDATSHLPRFVVLSNVRRRNDPAVVASARGGHRVVVGLNKAIRQRHLGRRREERPLLSNLCLNLRQWACHQSLLWMGHPTILWRSSASYSKCLTVPGVPGYRT